GGDPSPDVLPEAAVRKEVTADRDGIVAGVSALGLGRAALDLGAGRRTKEDSIDHAVGLRCFAKRGEPVEVGDTLVEVHASDEASADLAAEHIQPVTEIADT